MAMKVFNVGDVLAAADVNEYLVNTKFVTKPADTTRASTTTLANDPDLTVAVDANKSYFVEVLIQYLANVTPNLKASFTVPASATFNGHLVSMGVSTGTDAFVNAANVNVPITGSWHISGNITDVGFRVTGVLATAGTAGSFTLQWAQDTSSANTTIVRAGSFMLLRRCA